MNLTQPIGIRNSQEPMANSKRLVRFMLSQTPIERRCHTAARDRACPGNRGMARMETAA